MIVVHFALCVACLTMQDVHVTMKFFCACGDARSQQVGAGNAQSNSQYRCWLCATPADRYVATCLRFAELKIFCCVFDSWNRTVGKPVIFCRSIRRASNLRCITRLIITLDSRIAVSCVAIHSYRIFRTSTRSETCFDHRSFCISDFQTRCMCSKISVSRCTRILTVRLTLKR